MRRFSRTVLFGCLVTAVAAQEAPSNVSSAREADNIRDAVVPIAATKFFGPEVLSWQGAGFCLDEACRFVATNYHVAVMAKPGRIGGEKIVHTDLATSPGDEGAALNVFAGRGSGLKFTPSRDLAIFELRRPLRRRHGVAFRVEEPEIGDEVDIYSYPREGIFPVRELLKFHGRFKGKTDSGMLAFQYELADGKRIRPGASGGIVVNSGTQQIVGVLSGIALDGELVAVVVPVRSLVDFVSKVQPLLAQRIFPATHAAGEASGDFYPKLEPGPHPTELERRVEEPTTIQLLRRKAQSAADHMYQLVAVQTFAWGTGKRPPTEDQKCVVGLVVAHWHRVWTGDSGGWRGRG